MRRAGLEEHAREAMAEAVRLGRGRLPLFQQVEYLLPWLREKRRGFLLLECCATFARLEPGNLPVQIEYAYLGCVSGKFKPAETVDYFRKLREEHPGQAGVALGLATALLLDGQADDALAALDAAPPTEGAEPDIRESAVRAVALAVIGKEAEARRLLDQLDWQKLLQEERETFNKLLSRTRVRAD
jgi:hypothetical protein